MIMRGANIRVVKTSHFEWWGAAMFWSYKAYILNTVLGAL